MAAVTLYNSSQWAEFERAGAVNTSWLADQYLAKHPEIEESLEDSEDEYSVLPYKNENYESALKLLEAEMAREGYSPNQVVQLLIGTCFKLAGAGSAQPGKTTAEIQK